MGPSVVAAASSLPSTALALLTAPPPPLAPSSRLPHLTFHLVFLNLSSFNPLSQLPSRWLPNLASGSTPTFRAVLCFAASVSSSKAQQSAPRKRPLDISFTVRDEAGSCASRTTPPAGPVDESNNRDAASGLQLEQPAQGGFSKRVILQKKVVKGAPKYSKAARRFYNEKFRDPQRLSKVLAAAGVASRRSSEDVIFAGRVSVNGAVCNVPQTLVDPLKDIIYVDGRSLPKKQAPKLYFALNKPKGYICSSGGNESKSVLSLFDEYMKIWIQRNPGIPKPRLFSVGRLDVATSGLLLVTNDGEFTHKVSHPSSGLTKEYIATVGDKVTKRQIQVICTGTIVQGVQCVPVCVEVLDEEQVDSRQQLRIVVSEGRNHEIRHLVENAGLEVHALKRVRIGGLRLPRTLGLGKHQLLTEANVKKVLSENGESTV